MKPVIVVSNTAGGSGKSTTAHCLAVACAEYGKKVLLIDGDTKRDLTFRLGAEGSRINFSNLLNVKSGSDLETLTMDERIEFLPSATRPVELPDNCADIFKDLPEKFDLVIIDTPSSSSAVMNAFFLGATHMVIPISPTLHSFRGAVRAQRQAPENCEVFAFMNGCDDSDSSKVIRKEVNADFVVLDCEIPFSQDLRDAEKTVTSVLNFAQKSVVSESFRELAYSLLEKLQLI
ncbi:unannotated protein [freshwater metagenome]|uniref:Unannotated protein n=1 Tax=freshwater metagenome TaxID=449393 RepID=A0A6J7UYG4_9ZZZZ|nr:ParA family protein [Actinomycetota bacterium]